jgi:amidophosphoribosyltransferase
LCRACFDGEYPIELPAGNLIGKHLLEGVDRRVTGPARSTGEQVHQIGSAARGAAAQPALAAQPGGGDVPRHP